MGTAEIVKNRNDINKSDFGGNVHAQCYKPAFHAGEAFVKLWQMHAPRSSGGSQDLQHTLNAFYPAVKKYMYQPVVAQWLGVDDPDYIKIAKALKGWEVTAASSAVCCHAGKASPAKPPKKSNGKKKKPPTKDAVS